MSLPHPRSTAVLRPPHLLYLPGEKALAGESYKSFFGLEIIYIFQNHPSKVFTTTLTVFQAAPHTAADQRYRDCFNPVEYLRLSSNWSAISYHVSVLQSRGFPCLKWSGPEGRPRHYSHYTGKRTPAGPIPTGSC